MAHSGYPESVTQITHKFLVTYHYVGTPTSRSTCPIHERFWASVGHNDLSVHWPSAIFGSDVRLGFEFFQSGLGKRLPHALEASIIAMHGLLSVQAVFVLDNSALT